jgi:hypothetical protein
LLAASHDSRSVRPWIGLGQKFKPFKMQLQY